MAGLLDRVEGGFVGFGVEDLLDEILEVVEFDGFVHGAGDSGQHTGNAEAEHSDAIDVDAADSRVFLVETDGHIGSRMPWALMYTAFINIIVFIFLEIVFMGIYVQTTEFIRYT